MGSTLIVDSILTPFSWYSLLPIIGFAAFLFLVAAYQRSEFYWITDKATDVMHDLASRFRKKPRPVRESHVPWFITGNSSPAAYGIGMTTFQNNPGSAGYDLETFGAASSSGGATVLLNSAGTGQMDTASQVGPMSAHGTGNHVHSVPAVPVLIKVTDLSDWSASL
ncbi:hypothetical protein MTO96_008454 [Rhipicephalus appendiculatus]